jgi:hypothetical protein
MFLPTEERRKLGDIKALFFLVEGFGTQPSPKTRVTLLSAVRIICYEGSK